MADPTFIARCISRLALFFYLRPSYHRSSLGPSKAPISMHMAIVRPYHTAMNANESSLQCVA
jgi:hypothetical protein